MSNKWKHWDTVNGCGRSIVSTGIYLYRMKPQACIFRCERCKCFFLKKGDRFELYTPTKEEMDKIALKTIRSIQ